MVSQCGAITSGSHMIMTGCRCRSIKIHSFKAPFVRVFQSARKRRCRDASEGRKHKCTRSFGWWRWPSTPSSFPLIIFCRHVPQCNERSRFSALQKSRKKCSLCEYMGCYGCQSQERCGYRAYNGGRTSQFCWQNKSLETSDFFRCMRCRDYWLLAQISVVFVSNVRQRPKVCKLLKTQF